MNNFKSNNNSEISNSEGPPKKIKNTEDVSPHLWAQLRQSWADYYFTVDRIDSMELELELNKFQLQEQYPEQPQDLHARQYKTQINFELYTKKKERIEQKIQSLLDSLHIPSDDFRNSPPVNPPYWGARVV